MFDAVDVVANKAVCMDVVVQDSKPVWVWIESTMIGDTGRKPTTKEVKAEIWMALVHGARGYGYFCHSFGHGPHPVFQEDAMLVDTEMAAAVKAINLGVLRNNVMACILRRTIVDWPTWRHCCNSVDSLVRTLASL